MDAQRIAEVDDTVDHPLVQVEGQLAPLRRFGVRQCLDERLLVSDGGVARVLNEPIDETDLLLDFRYEAERQQDLRPVVGLLGEVGQKAHDRIGVQQLRLGERRTLIALEIQPTHFTLPGGDQDHAAVGHQLLINRQGVGRRDTGTLAVSHGSRHPDEHDALDPGADQSTEPLTQRRFIHESGDLAAQSAHPGQLRLDDRPEIQHVQLRLHLDRPVILFRDQPRHHHVPDPAFDPGFRRQLQHFVGLFDRLLRTAIDIRRHQLKRDGVEGQRAAPHPTTSSPAAAGQVLRTHVRPEAALATEPAPRTTTA